MTSNEPRNVPETSSELLTIRLSPSAKERWVRYRKATGMTSGDAFDALLRMAEECGLVDGSANKEASELVEAAARIEVLRYQLAEARLKETLAVGKLEEAEARSDLARASAGRAASSSRRLRLELEEGLDALRRLCGDAPELLREVSERYWILDDGAAPEERDSRGAAAENAQAPSSPSSSSSAPRR